MRRSQKRTTPATRPHKRPSSAIRGLFTEAGAPSSGRRPFGLAVACFLAALLLSAASCSEDPAKRVYEEAESILASGNYVLALSGYSEIVGKHTKSPYAPKSQLRVAEIYRRFLNDPGRAIEAYATLEIAFPDTIEASTAVQEAGRLYSAMGDHAMAISQYRRLAKMLPDNAQRLQFAVALEYMKMDDFAQAKAELHELIESEADDLLLPRAHFQLANIHYIQGEASEAMEHYDVIISSYPSHEIAVEAEFAKARSLEETGRTSEALVMLRGLVGRHLDKEIILKRIDGIERRLKSERGG